MSLAYRIPQLPLQQDSPLFLAVDPLPFKIQVRAFRTPFHRDAWVLAQTAWLRCSARASEMPAGVLLAFRRIVEAIERDGML